MISKPQINRSCFVTFLSTKFTIKLQLMQKHHPQTYRASGYQLFRYFSKRDLQVSVCNACVGGWLKHGSQQHLISDVPSISNMSKLFAASADRRIANVTVLPVTFCELLGLLSLFQTAKFRVIARVAARCNLNSSLLVKVETFETVLILFISLCMFFKWVKK